MTTASRGRSFDPFQVTVPASSANIGPGFDCLGVAVSLHLRLTIRPATEFTLNMRGEGSTALPRDRSNLLVRAFTAAVNAGPDPAHLDPSIEPPAVEMTTDNAVPLARGLGSSSTALVAGLAAGRRLATGIEPERTWVLETAARLEGHPDNVAPAVLGDLVVSGIEGDRVVALRESWPEELIPVAIIPRVTIETEAARRALPRQVPFEDAVGNSGRLARLLVALRRSDFAELGDALEDRLHQPYRLPLLPGLGETLDRLRSSPGVLGAYLSGSGPTLVALTDRDHAQEVSRSAIDLCATAGIEAGSRVLSVDRHGLRVV